MTSLELINRSEGPDADRGDGGETGGDRVDLEVYKKRWRKHREAVHSGKVSGGRQGVDGWMEDRCQRLGREWWCMKKWIRVSCVIRQVQPSTNKALWPDPETMKHRVSRARRVCDTTACPRVRVCGSVGVSGAGSTSDWFRHVPRAVSVG